MVLTCSITSLIHTHVCAHTHTFNLTYSCSQPTFQLYRGQWNGPQELQASFSTWAPAPSHTPLSDVYMPFFLQDPSSWCYFSLKPSTESDASLLCFVTAFLLTQIKISPLQVLQGTPSLTRKACPSAPGPCAQYFWGPCHSHQVQPPAQRSP